MQKNIIYLLFPLIFSSGIHSVNSQVLRHYNDFSIFLGDKHREKGFITNLSKTTSNKVLCVQGYTTFLNIFSKNNSKFSFGYIQNYVLPESKKIKFYGEGKKTNLILYSSLGNKVLGLSYRRGSYGRPNLYYHFIDPASKSKNYHGFSIPESFDIPYKNIELSRFVMATSSDRNHAAILYLPETSAKGISPINYLLFDTTFSQPQQKGFLFPFSSNDFQALDFFISNKSNPLFISGHYKTTTGNSTAPTSLFQMIRITKIDSNAISLKSITSKGKYFTSVKCYEKNNHYYITGLYTLHPKERVEGIMNAKLSKSGEIISCFYTPFSSLIQRKIEINNQLTHGEDLRYSSGDNQFKIIQCYKTSAGYITIMEYQALEYRYGGMSTVGPARTIDKYNWRNDLIISKISNTGELIWDIDVPKIQRSINDHGYYLSTATYLSKRKLHLFFNGNSSNYNADRMFTGGKNGIELARLNSFKNTIIHVSISLQEGKIERESTIGKSETNVVFVPSLAVALPHQRQLLIFGNNGNTYRLGSITFSKNK